MITRAERGVEWLLQHFPHTHVIYVAGNHEHYQADFRWTIDKAKLAAAGSLVHVLENDAVVIDGVEFLGATLWTYFALLGESTVPEAMSAAGLRMNDYRQIRTDGYSMAKRMRQTQTLNWSITAKGINFVLPKTDDPSPTYSRRELKRIIASLQEALDDEMGATLLR